MRSKCILTLAVATLFLAVTLPISAQSSASAYRGGWPVIIGAGFSRFNMAFPPGSGKNYEQGATVWADWTKIPLIPRNFGLEGEYRRLSFNPPPSNPGLRSNVFLGGPTYTWNFSRLSIYGKGMFGYGAIHFSGYEPYTNDSRTLTAVGGGAQYHITNGVLLRADYEYQWWPALITGRFQPNGLTIGLAYDFRTVGRRY